MGDAGATPPLKKSTGEMTWTEVMQPMLTPGDWDPDAPITCVTSGPHSPQALVVPQLPQVFAEPGRVQLMAPSGGVERPRRKVRFARLIHAARPRSWRTFGPRRLACLLLRVVEEATAFPPAARDPLAGGQAADGADLRLRPSAFEAPASRAVRFRGGDLARGVEGEAVQGYGRRLRHTRMAAVCSG
jgi:hypothetical protein